MRVLILLPTYKRPDMVMTAINSVLTQDCDQWELVVIDDNEERTVENDSRYHVFHTGHSDDFKRTAGGSMHGAFMNIYMENFRHGHQKCAIAIILCDDDALIPGYIGGLIDYFIEHPEVQHAYSHVRCFDPTQETPEEVGERKDGRYFNHTAPLNPAGRVDASQVAWRLPTLARFKTVGVENLDMDFFGQLYELYGPCQFTGLDGQYKAMFPGQLGSRPDPFVMESDEATNGGDCNG